MKPDLHKSMIARRLLGVALVTLGIAACGSVLRAGTADPAQGTATGPGDANNLSYPVRLQQIGQHLDRMTPAVPEIRHSLDLLLELCKSLSDPNVQERAASLKEECATLSNRIRELQREIEKLKAALKAKEEDPSSESLEGLRRMLKDAETRRDQLAAEAASLRQRLTDSQEERGQGTFELASGMTPKYAMITRNRIVPIKTPYFEFNTVWTNRGLMQQVKRVQDGENVEDAIKSGGCLDTMLGEIDLATEYVKFLVCSDSIPAFRIAAKTAKKRHVGMAWTTIKDEPLYATSGGSNGAIPIRRK
jgi:hypothetical protein